MNRHFPHIADLEVDRRRDRAKYGASEAGVHQDHYTVQWADITERGHPLNVVNETSRESAKGGVP